MTDDPRLGLSVTHRRYVPYAHAHYAGDLVDGAYVLGLFGDVATEVCIRTDGDEGLFASYSDVQFRAPVRAGDVVEAEATVTRVGTRSRELSLVARVVCRGAVAGAGDLAAGPSAAVVLDPPIVAVTAVGTVVVPVATTT
jgi:3-aminobutyryl-CoA ammonia-lyase